MDHAKADPPVRPTPEPAPDGDVATLVVAVARLRPDVGPGQRHVAVGRHREAGWRDEVGTAFRRVGDGGHGDADRGAGIVDPAEDLKRIRGELLETSTGLERRRAAHHAASRPTLVTTGGLAGSPSAQ